MEKRWVFVVILNFESLAIDLLLLYDRYIKKWSIPDNIFDLSLSLWKSIQKYLQNLICFNPILLKNDYSLLNSFSPTNHSMICASWESVCNKMSQSSPILKASQIQVNEISKREMGHAMLGRYWIQEFSERLFVQNIKLRKYTSLKNVQLNLKIKIHNSFGI